MNAKTNIQAVPTPLDRLHAKQAELAKLSAEGERIRDKIDALAPIEAEVAQARAELGQVIAADEKAIRVWVEAGGKGATPSGNTPAREAAARKLAAAQSKLTAAQGVRGDLEQEWQALCDRARPFESEIKTLAVDVVGEEALRAVTAYRNAVVTMLEAEAYYWAVVRRLELIPEKPQASAYIDEHGHLTSPSDTASGALLSQWRQRLNKEMQVSAEQRKEASERAVRQVDQKVAQLLSAKEPAK